MSADEEAEFDPGPHKSGLAYVKISLWKQGETAADPPTEAILVPLSDGKHAALDGDVVTDEEWIRSFLDLHLDGECECLSDTAEDGGDSA